MLINLLEFHYLFTFIDAEADNDIVARKLPNSSGSTKIDSLKSF